MNFLLNATKEIFAVSKTDLLAIFKKFAKCLSEKEPDPSAILLEILKEALLNCSATQKLLSSLNLSARSNNRSFISIDSFQISKSINRKCAINKSFAKGREQSAKS